MTEDEYLDSLEHERPRGDDCYDPLVEQYYEDLIKEWEEDIRAGLMQGEYW